MNIELEWLYQNVKMTVAFFYRFVSSICEKVMVINYELLKRKEWKNRDELFSNLGWVC